LPEIGISNFFIQAGAHAVREIYAPYQQFVEVTDVIGMHMADAISGDFSVGFQGFLWQDGKRLHPLKSMTISGNLHALLASAVGVANDLQFYGQYGAPSVLVPQIVISG
jgi:PmbA protein